MSPLQTALYFREWGVVRQHYRAKGIDAAQVDAKRHQLHKQALGVMKSSKKFTNADLDKVLAVFRAITQPDNLNAQLHAIEQPEQRMAKLHADCRAIVLQLPKIAAAQHPETYADNYINQVAFSLAGVVFYALSEQNAARVLGILRHRFPSLAKAAELAANNCAF